MSGCLCRVENDETYPLIESIPGWARPGGLSAFTAWPLSRYDRGRDAMDAGQQPGSQGSISGARTLTSLRRRLDKLLAQRSEAVSSVKRERLALLEARENLKSSLKAQEVLQGVAQQVQQFAHVRISRVVTRCLESVFGDEAYEFRLAFDRKRGKTEARAVFVRDGNELSWRDVGGGVVDLTSFSLRLASLILTRPKLRGLLCLDEPFRMLSVNHSAAVREMLVGLAKEMKIQMVVVTHNQLLRGPGTNVIDLEMNA